MPRSNLTQLAVERLNPPAEGTVTHWDKLLPGFGVRVSARGRKTWVAIYRVNGKSVMQTLGTSATVPRLADARDLARAAMNQARAGIHPVEERRAAARVAEASAAARQEAEREAVEGRFDVVAERFLRERGRAEGWSPKYAAQFRRTLGHNVMPRWGERPIRAIGKHDVNELLDAKASRRERPRKGTQGGAAVESNRLLTRLRTLFAWAAAHDLIDGDPSAGVLPRGKETARDRALSDAEIKIFWSSCEAIGWPFGSILRLLLLTGQREFEVAGMRWSEIDGCTWTIPRERTKSDRAHIVHLSKFAAEIVEGMPRIAGGLLFPSRVGKPVTSFSKAKIRLDALMARQAPEPIAPWVIHDLRRTATTIMARLNVAPHVADKVLNHSGGTIRGVAATYNRFQYIDERRAALEALGRFVESLVRPGGKDNVVPLRA